MHPTGRRWTGWSSRWRAHATSGKFLYINILLVLLHNALPASALRKGKLVLPSSYTALGDDLDIQLHADPLELATAGRLKLQIARTLPAGAGTVATTLDIRLDANHNVTQIKVPCFHFLHGGDYELAVLEESTDPDRIIDERLRQPLRVDWPAVRLAIVPNRTDTYPEVKVQGILEFEQVRCQLPASGADSLDLPELWLELFYCGKSAESCSDVNATVPFSKAQILYIEQVRGLPRSRVIDFRCDLFGLAGFYALHLKPSGDPSMGELLQARAILQADWSKQYVFTVHTRSIFPCDPHGPGIRVLFQYPACILNQADRVRVYAKLRADVLSLAPPTSLHYVAEQRVTKGQHSLHFECDLFYEKFVEYCFVYVSQAISGAVADIRMDCVPTLPVSASDSGGWGPWSNWTHCSTTCRGGIRNRYRFCDSPPPRYGAKFCEGASVQTERCGLESSGDSWECMFSPAIGNINLPLEIEDVNTEIGPGCRCGCVIHLGMVKPKRLLGSSSHSCPDRSLWLIKGDQGCHIRMAIDFHKFPCDGQWLKVRDGDSVADELLLQFGADQTGSEESSTLAEASGNVLLVEFFSRKTDHYDEACNAGFLGQAEQIKLNQTLTVGPDNSTTIASKVIMPIVQSLRSYASFTIAHVCAIAFICFIVLVSFLLVVQYLFRYRKYELATSRMEAADSPAHTLFGSNQSLGGATEPMQPRSRAVSTTTLISEIVSYVKLRPLRVTTAIRHERFRESVEYTLDSTGSRSEGVPSDGSTEIIMELQDRITDGDEKQHEDANEETPLQSLNDLNHPEGRGEPSPRARKTSAGSSRLEDVHDTDDERSATVSSVYSSLNREKTPLVARKNGSAGRPHTTDTLRSEQHLVKSATCLMTTSSTSTATLTNVSPSDVECCSPPDPGVQSPLTRRNTGSSSMRGTRNAKESKEKRNLQKLLAGSDFSLGAPSEQDMELDYYDYNVINAGAAPGSYLGMDPAFLVWIPPLDGEEDVDASDDDRELTELTNRSDPMGEGESRSASVTPSAELIRQLAEQKRNDYIIVSHSISKSDVCSESDGDTKLSTERRRRKLHELILVRRKGGSGADGGSDAGSGSSVRKSSSDESTEEREKETSFTKSPVDNKQISDFYEMADIAFADDEADEEEEDDQEKASPGSGGFCEDHPKGGTLLPTTRKVEGSSEESKYQTVVTAGDLRREDEHLVQ
uniref:CUB domain-containing protein n=1 Tax=Anopheles atroparvus TaxID=41427 RepID=A0AAG5D068_ANOAO